MWPPVGSGAGQRGGDGAKATGGRAGPNRVGSNRSVIRALSDRRSVNRGGGADRDPGANEVDAGASGVAAVVAGGSGVAPRRKRGRKPATEAGASRCGTTGSEKQVVSLEGGCSGGPNSAPNRGADSPRRPARGRHRATEGGKSASEPVHGGIWQGKRQKRHAGGHEGRVGGPKAHESGPRNPQNRHRPPDFRYVTAWRTGCLGKPASGGCPGPLTAEAAVLRGCEWPAKPRN
jgi:hypothetical protein